MTAAALGSGLVAATWTIDPSHSEVGFSVRHLMSKVRGRFADFSGTITTTGDDPATSSVSVEIVSASISTNNEQRDGHLRSTDFFNAEHGEKLVFTSTGISATDDGYTISGDLTINGITHPVALATEFLGVDVDAYGQTRLGAEATTSISRKAFDVDFNVPLEGGKLLIGDKIDITLSLEAVRA